MFYKIWFVAYLVSSAVNAKHIKGIQIKNRGHEKLWVEMTDEEGFFLPPGQLASVIVEDNWSGRIQAQSVDCKTKNCNTPYTMAVFKFAGEHNEDTYYISIAEGFNRPMKIEPTSVDHSCKTAVCHANINHHCSLTHQVKHDDGVVFACKPEVGLFQQLCPQALVSEAQLNSNTFLCKSNTYIVVIG